MKMNMKSLISIAVSAFLLTSAGGVSAAPDATSETDSKTNVAPPVENKTGNSSNATEQSTISLPNGLYLVIDEADEHKKLSPIGNQQIVVYDYQFFPLADRDAASYLIISPDQYIPLKLGIEPQKEKDLEGKSKLMLQLAQDQISPLEEFTNKNLGKAVAIVIGSKVVTKHKIKEAIKGGKMQITRCSDNGCDILYTQLQQNTQ
jgi:hypothetical protein